MTGPSFTVSITVPRPPLAVFEAIADPRAWWGRDIEGRTDLPGADWTYRYQDLHVSRQRTTALEPARRIVWEVVDAEISFLADKSEWRGTSLVFDLEASGEGTKVTFTHVGLVPEVECYDICTRSWTGLVTESLAKLLREGAGRPDEVLAPV